MTTSTQLGPRRSRATLLTLAIAGATIGTAVAFLMQWVLDTGPDLAWRAGNTAILDVTYLPPGGLVFLLAVGWGTTAGLLTYLIGRRRASVRASLGAAIAGPWTLAVPLGCVLIVSSALTFDPSAPLGGSPILFGVVWAALCAVLGTAVFAAVLLGTIPKRALDE